MSAIPGGKLSIQVFFKMRGLVNKIFLIHLVITQGDNSDKTRKFYQMSIKIESSRNITNGQLCTQSPTSNGNERLCVRLQIDQMSIKIESSGNITNVSAIDLKVQLQIATSVCASDFKLIKCRLK